jgi:hypothetical protein
LALSFETGLVASAKRAGRFSEQNFTSAFCTFSTSSLGRFNALTIQPFSVREAMRERLVFLESNRFAAGIL